MLSTDTWRYSGHFPAISPAMKRGQCCRGSLETRGVGQEPGKQVRVGDRPGKLTENVDEDGPLRQVQHLLLLAPPAGGRVEHERIPRHDFLHGVAVQVCQ